MADATSKRNVTTPAPVTRPVQVRPQSSAVKAAQSAAVTAAGKRIAASRGALPSQAAGLDGIDGDDLDAIDAWLAARLGELRHAEARLAQREAKMTAASTGLAKLLEGIKHQVMQAEHVRSAITETHHNAVKWFEQIAQSNNGRLDSVEASWAERIAKLEQVDSQVDEWVHDIEERAASLVKPVQERIERTVADMHTLVLEAVAKSEGTVQQGIDAAMAQAIEQAGGVIEEKARQIADNVLANMRESLEKQVEQTSHRTIEAALSKARQDVDGALAAQRDVMHAEVEDLHATTESMLAHLKADALKVREIIDVEATRSSDIAQQLQDAVDDQVRKVIAQMDEVKAAVAEHAEELASSTSDWRERSEQACAAILDHTHEAEQAAKMRGAQLLDGLESQFDQAVADAEQRINAARESMGQATDQAIEAARQRIADQVTQMRAAGTTATGPIMAELQERITTFREQTHTIMSDLDATMANKMQALQDHAASQQSGHLESLRRDMDIQLQQVQTAIEQRLEAFQESAADLVTQIDMEADKRIRVLGKDGEARIRDVLQPLAAQVAEEIDAATEVAAEQKRVIIAQIRKDAANDVRRVRQALSKALRRTQHEGAKLSTHADTALAVAEGKLQEQINSMSRQVHEAADALEQAIVNRAAAMKPLAESAGSDATKSLESCEQLIQQRTAKLASIVEAGAALARESLDGRESELAALAAELRQSVDARIAALQAMIDAASADASRSLDSHEQQLRQRAAAIATNLDTAVTAAAEGFAGKQNDLMARAAALVPFIEGTAIKAGETLQSHRASLVADADELMKLIDAAAQQAAGKLDDHAAAMQSRLDADISPLVADMDAQLTAMRSRCDQTMQHVTQQRDIAAAMLAKVSESKLDLSPDLIDELDIVTAAGRSLVGRLEEQTRYSSEVAARMESLTKTVARLGETDPNADTVDLDAGTPLWLENAERMLHDLERSLAASRCTLAALEEARQSLAAQTQRPATGKPRHAAVHVPLVGDEDEPAVERDGGTSLAEAMMIVSQQVAGTAVKPEALEAAVRSIESLNQLARDVASPTQHYDAPVAKPRRGDKTAIDRYAEDLRRRIEEARKAR